MNQLCESRCECTFISNFLYFSQKIDNEIKAQVDEATKKAKADKEIGLEELTGDIYSNTLEPVIRGTTPYNPMSHITVSRNI